MREIMLNDKKFVIDSRVADEYNFKAEKQCMDNLQAFYAKFLYQQMKLS